MSGVVHCAVTAVSFAGVSLLYTPVFFLQFFKMLCRAVFYAYLSADIQRHPLCGRQVRGELPRGQRRGPCPGLPRGTPLRQVGTREETTSVTPHPTPFCVLNSPFGGHE